MHNLNVLVNAGPPAALAWLDYDEFDALDADAEPVFLGLLDGKAHFVADVSDVADARRVLASGGRRFEDCRSAAERMVGPQTGIIAQARAQLDWHNRHGHCSVCGERTNIGRGGQVRRCPSCRAEHFPRTDPVVITVVTDGDRCLLGQSRGRLQQMKMYSALAGFMDQGENIEEAVAREIMEEAGIAVKNVRYHSSQPWPFPSSLMIGCHAEAATTEIAMDPEEMTDVQWFDRAEGAARSGGQERRAGRARADRNRPSSHQGLGERGGRKGVRVTPRRLDREHYHRTRIKGTSSTFGD